MWFLIFCMYLTQSTLCFPTLSPDANSVTQTKGVFCQGRRLLLSSVYLSGHYPLWTRLRMHFNRMRAVTSVRSRGVGAPVELRGWLEPALRAATAPSWVLSWLDGLSCITGSGWLRAQAAFRAAGWAAASQPSTRGERGGLFYKSTHQLKSRTLIDHKCLITVVSTHTANMQQSWEGPRFTPAR